MHGRSIGVLAALSLGFLLPLAIWFEDQDVARYGETNQAHTTALPRPWYWRFDPRYRDRGNEQQVISSSVIPTGQSGLYLGLLLLSGIFLSMWRLVQAMAKKQRLTSDLSMDALRLRKQEHLCEAANSADNLENPLLSNLGRTKSSAQSEWPPIVEAWRSPPCHSVSHAWYFKACSYVSALLLLGLVPFCLIFLVTFFVMASCCIGLQQYSALREKDQGTAIWFVLVIVHVVLVAIDSLAHFIVCFFALGDRCPARVHMTARQHGGLCRTIALLWTFVAVALITGWIVASYWGARATTPQHALLRSFLSCIIVGIPTLPFVPLLLAAQVQLDWLGAVVHGACVAKPESLREELRTAARRVAEAVTFWSPALAMHISLGTLSFVTGLGALWFAVIEPQSANTAFFGFDQVARWLPGNVVVSGILLLAQLIAVAEYNSRICKEARKTEEMEVFMYYHQGKLTIKFFWIELSWSKFTAMAISAGISAGISIVKILISLVVQQ